MQTLSLTREQISLWNGGSGSVEVVLESADLAAPLTPENSTLLNMTFQVNGSEPLTFGLPQEVKLGITAHTKALLKVIWPSSPDQSSMTDHGLAGYFTAHPGDLVLALQLGAAADATASVSVQYLQLAASATLNAGTDAGYTLLKAYPSRVAAGPLLLDFAQHIRLPGSITQPLPIGEVINFEYGGYARLCATLSAGYEIKGTPFTKDRPFGVGDLKLSEHYQFSALGSLTATASIAGRFTIEVRGATTPEQESGRWVEVLVRRARSREIGVAADVRLESTNQLDGLPESADEFLGALLGVNSKNWFNYLTAVARAKSFEDIKQVTDNLAQHYLSRLINQGFEQIAADVEPALRAVNRIVTAYQSFDNRAINLFDLYFDRVDTVLTNALDTITKLDSRTALLSKKLDPDLARVIATLTDSDFRKPVSWMLSMSGVVDGDLEGVKNRAKALLESIRTGAHTEILSAIRLAKTEFGLEPLFGELAQYDTAPELLQKVNEKVGGFASRIIGQALAGVGSAKELQGPIRKLREVLEKRQQFATTLYAKFTDAVNSRYKLNLHAEYTRASERDALVHAFVNVESTEGQALLDAAGSGDFAPLLTSIDAKVVRLHEGVLSHRVAKKSAFTVNVVGWHDRFQYLNTGLDRVITDAEQHIKTELDGGLSVYTTFSLTKERERRTGLVRSQERIFTSFLMQFVGESKGALKFGNESKMYLVDAIRAMGARYNLSFSDRSTRPEELTYYLRFAQELGLLPSGTSIQQVARMLPMSDGTYGQVTATYEVRYSPQGLESMFSGAITDAAIRTIMRRMVLANYVVESASRAWLADIGWCYWTDGVYPLWRKGQSAFTGHSALTFQPIKPAPGLPVESPPAVTLNKDQLSKLSTLYYIEDDIVRAMIALRDLLNPKETPLSGNIPRVEPEDFRKNLETLGDALKSFDDFDEGVNTIFALFDQLIRLSTAAAEARNSSLLLQAVAGGHNVSQIYLSPSQALGEVGSMAGRAAQSLDR